MAQGARRNQNLHTLHQASVVRVNVTLALIHERIVCAMNEMVID